MAVRAAAGLSSVCSSLWPHRRLNGRPRRSGRQFVPVATDARLGGDEAQTRFVMDFSRKIELHAFTLADPYRVVIDIPQVTFQLPPKAGESGRGLIRAFRFGLVMQGGSRVVFDLAKPARIDKAFVVDPTDGAPARLVLELSRRIARASCARSRSTTSSSRPICRAPAAGSQERRSASARRARSRPRRHRHRRKGPAGEEEKDMVLNFAQRLRDRVESPASIWVLMTRTDDTFVHSRG